MFTRRLGSDSMYFETMKSHITTFSEVEVEMVSKMVEIHFILAGKTSQQKHKMCDF
jgi:hypothetical protein